VVANTNGLIEYLILPVWAALAGAAAGWVSYRLASGTAASVSAT
jgi:hypothetical protein